MITGIELENFTAFQKLDVALSPRLNVIIGSNGTGKTLLLKAIYALAIASEPVEKGDRSKGELSKKLLRIFLPTEDKIGALRFGGATTRARLSLTSSDESGIGISFNYNSETAKIEKGRSPRGKVSRPVFIPTKEVLSLARGMRHPEHHRATVELIFDDTYIDLAELLFRPGCDDDGSSLAEDPRLSSVLRELVDLIGGRYRWRDGGFAFEAGSYQEKVDPDAPKTKAAQLYRDSTVTQFAPKGEEELSSSLTADAYGLQDELTPEVPLEEITLTCNPAYRYGGKKSEAELEALLLADTMRELVSYAVGCMLGRYSLDKPGLILANQGEGVADYLAKVPDPSFPPDADNVLPVLEGEWFADDIAARFRRFLRIAFGEAHFQANLAFVEAALGKDIRKYLVRDFFNDHVKRYKKRPIYWLFSSRNGTFNALIYTHRYRPDTVSVVLNSYLREFRSKLEGHRRELEALSISGAASAAQKAKALKEIEATARQIEEIDAWERDVLFPLASQRIEIDLDDGVKANYPKFGAALKPIKGLNDAEE